MKSVYNRFTLVILFFLTILMLGLNFVPGRLRDVAVYGQTWEAYDETLFPKIQSVDDLVNMVKAHSDMNNQVQVLENLTYLVRNRFYHGYSNYSFSENWIAAVGGGVIWEHLGAIVDPDDILKYRMAACSQVGIVIMAALSKLNIPCRKVGLIGHFALEAKIKNKWYYIDANLEPDFNKIGGRTSLDQILAKKQQYLLYAGKGLDSNRISLIFSHPKYYRVNKRMAPNALFFHKVTKFFSYWGWLLPGGFFVYGLKKRKQNQNQQESESNYEPELTEAYKKQASLVV